MKPVLFIKETLAEAIEVLSSRERLKSLYGVSLYRNAVYLMLNSVVLALTGFFFWALAARLYTTESVGLAAAAISAMGLVALLSTLGLDYGLIRFLPSASDKAKDMINCCFTIAGTVSIALSLVFLAGLSLWCPALLPIRAHPIFFISFVIFTIAATLTMFTQQSFIAKRKAGFALAQRGLLFGLLRFIPLVILAALFHTFGIFAAWGIALVVALAVGIFLFLPKVQADYRPLPAVSKQAVTEMMRFSFTNYAANILWGIPALLLPLMVVNLLGAQPNAYFYIGWAIGGILFIIPGAASFSLFAEGSHDEEKLAGDIKRGLKLVLLLLIPAIMIIFFLGDKILLLFGEAYSENATRLLQVLAVSALPLSINHIYFSVKRVEMRMKIVVGLSALTAVAALALSYFLLPKMGVIGAGVSWLVTQSIVAVVVISILLRKHHRSTLSNLDT